VLNPKNIGANEEQWETFKRRGREYCQYDYRDERGELFSVIKPTLEKCREERDKWLKRRSG